MPCSVDFARSLSARMAGHIHPAVIVDISEPAVRLVDEFAAVLTLNAENAPSFLNPKTESAGDRLFRHQTPKLSDTLNTGVMR